MSQYRSFSKKVNAFRMTAGPVKGDTGGFNAFPSWINNALFTGKDEPFKPGSISSASNVSTGCDNEWYVISNIGKIMICQLGDWIVQTEDGSLEVYNDHTFRHTFAPYIEGCDEPLAISSSDFNRHGCPYCNYAYAGFNVSSGGTSVGHCANPECDRFFMVVSDDLDRANIAIGKSCGLIIKPGEWTEEDDMKCIRPFRRDHPRKRCDRLMPGDPGSHPDGGEYFYSRGIGTDSGACCFVTGQELQFGKNIAGYVKHKECGLRVVGMFGDKGGAWLDYRPNEPTYIQVKILCCLEQAHCLEHLHELVSKDNRITPEMIEEARAMVKEPCVENA